MKSIESDKKKYLSLTLQRFFQDWAYLERLLDSNGLKVYNIIKGIVDTPEINWRFNKIICSAFYKDKLFGVCDGLESMPAMIELMEMQNNDFQDYYLCKCNKIIKDETLDTLSPLYFIVHLPYKLEGKSDRFKEDVRKALDRIYDKKEGNGFQVNDCVLQCHRLTNARFDKLLNVITDKGNYDFNKIKCLTFDGFKDSEQFKRKIDELINGSEKQSFVLSFKGILENARNC